MRVSTLLFRWVLHILDLVDLDVLSLAINLLLLDGIVHLRRGVGELIRIGHDQADLDGLLRVR
jgi:hypothetical protein